MAYMQQGLSRLALVCEMLLIRGASHHGAILDCCRLQVTVVEETSKGDMLLKTGQMAVRIMHDFQVCNEPQRRVVTLFSTFVVAFRLQLARCESAVALCTASPGRL